LTPPHRLPNLKPASGTPPLLFDIFGERIAVCTEDAAVRAHIAAALTAFQTARYDDPCAVFHLVQRDHESPVCNGQQFNNGTLLIIADRHKLITASLGATPWQIHIEAYRRSTVYVYGYLFSPLLLMVLKRRNLVHCHGAAVHRRHVVLIVGGSGAGKSTTALSLLLHGYGFIADDELFLQTGSEGVYARGAERCLHLTDETASLLRGFPSAAELPLVQRGLRLKRRLEAGHFPPADKSDPTVLPGPVRIVIFPRVESGSLTSLRPLPAAEAMRRLILQPPKEQPVIADKPALERQFAACASLAASAHAFELLLGRDVDRVAPLIDEVMA
jgi:hypothetical protein